MYQATITCVITTVIKSINNYDPNMVKFDRPIQTSIYQSNSLKIERKEKEY